MTLAALIFLILVSLLALFQLSLALGAPLGAFAWGGQHQVLPRKLRLGSLASIGLYAAFAIMVMSKAFSEIIPQGAYLNIALWCLFGYLVIGIVMNAASRSKPERYTMTPVVCVLALCTLVVALG